MAIPLAFTTRNAAQDAKAAFEGEDAVIVRAADGIRGADFVRVEGLSALLVELARIDDVFILNRGASHVRPERGDHVSWGAQTLDVRVWLGRHLKKRGDLDLRLERGEGIFEGMHSRDTEHQLCKVRADNVPSSADANFTSVVGSSHLGARSKLEAERRSGLKAQRGELNCALGLAVVARDSCGEGGRA